MKTLRVLLLVGWFMALSAVLTAFLLGMTVVVGLTLSPFARGLILVVVTMGSMGFVMLSRGAGKMMDEQIHALQGWSTRRRHRGATPKHLEER